MVGGSKQGSPFTGSMPKGALLGAEQQPKPEPVVPPRPTREAAAEYEKAMRLLAAARAEELRAQAVKLAPEMKRHQVPSEFLANPEMARCRGLA